MNYYIGYWRFPGNRDALHGIIKADTEEQAYDILKARLMHGCIITAIYKCRPNARPGKHAIYVNTSWEEFNHDRKK